MATITIPAAPGDDLFRIAAEQYGDPEGWVLIAAANGLVDPLIQASVALAIPEYNPARTNGGVLTFPGVAA